jgi:hypothetical protein
VLVGSEVVYLAGRGVGQATMTPYDVCALRLGDASVLAGTPPEDAARYLEAIGSRGAVALTAAGMVAASDLLSLIEQLCRMSWIEAEAIARGAGALVGAYPAEALEPPR